MHKRSATAGSIVFFVLAPGVVAGLIPWLLTNRYERFSTIPGAKAIAALVILASLAVLIHAFVRFVTEGRGTPAPVAPTDALVIGGIYRFVRNPMYLAVIASILGQAMLFGSVALLIWTFIAGATMATFVLVYEEPTLAERYGAQYDAYRDAVPGWLPRLTPWRQE